jgi:hypothetical protein
MRLKLLPKVNLITVTKKVTDMTLKNWIIDLHCDFETKEQEEIMLNEVRAAAKMLLTQARLLADKRKPDIAIHNDDMYEGRDQIDLFTQEEKEEYGI